MASRGRVGLGTAGAPPKQRLLSPQEAATYLGLGSRWAVRRLVASGALPVVRLAGKWRLDVEDLDRLIANHKTQAGEERLGASSSSTPEGGRLRMAPRAGLAPFPNRRRQVGDSSVTPHAQVLDPAVLKTRATDSQSGARPRMDTR
jgi:excisionase family DNA binding protein